MIINYDWNEGKRGEWASGGGSVVDDRDPNKFILHREGCPVYKGKFLTKEVFQNYEYIIDMQHRAIMMYVSILFFLIINNNHFVTNGAQNMRNLAFH